MSFSQPQLPSVPQAPAPPPMFGAMAQKKKQGQTGAPVQPTLLGGQAQTQQKTLLGQ